jgi:hypothetical protein
VLRSALFAVLGALIPAVAVAQITPAESYTPPDDTPSIRLGVTIYADYTYQDTPQIKDADGNTINPNAFNVTRSYVNVTGNLSHIVAFRITPDIMRQSGLITLVSPDTITNDSLLCRRGRVDVPGRQPDRLLLWRELHQELRAQARRRSGDVPTAIRQRRLGLCRRP